MEAVISGQINCGPILHCHLPDRQSMIHKLTCHHNGNKQLEMSHTLLHSILQRITLLIIANITVGYGWEKAFSPEDFSSLALYLCITMYDLCPQGRLGERFYVVGGLNYCEDHQTVALESCAG